MRLFLSSYSHALTGTALQIGNFSVRSFVRLLGAVPSSTKDRVGTFDRVFSPVAGFIRKLSRHVTRVAGRLNDLVSGLGSLVSRKVSGIRTVTSEVIDFVGRGLTTTRGTLRRVRACVNSMAGSVRRFVGDTKGRIRNVITRTGRTVGRITRATRGNVGDLTRAIGSRARGIERSVRRVGNGVSRRLGSRRLGEGVHGLLNRIASRLSHRRIRRTVNTTSDDVSGVTGTLRRVSLGSAFSLAMAGSEDLRDSFHTVSMTGLNATRGATLKINGGVLRDISMPKVMGPGLGRTFRSILRPILGVISRIRRRMSRIGLRMRDFRPKALLGSFLQPRVSDFIRTLGRCHPSRLLGKVGTLCSGVLGDLRRLSPGRLITVLRKLCRRVTGVTRTLSPRKLVGLLRGRAEGVRSLLNRLPVNRLVSHVRSTLKDIRGLFTKLNLSRVLTPKF